MSFSGYGKTPMNSNVNSSLVNKDSSNYPGGFSSNEIPGQNGLPGYSGVKNNAAAANMSRGGSRCAIGGKGCGCSKNFKTLKRKIKNIIKVYKMKGKRTLKSIKKRLMKFKKGGKSKKLGKRTRRSYKMHGEMHGEMHGGYAQYQNNQPLVPTYSLGGVLPASESALANPPPYKVGSTCVNCVDNYNHYTGKGFPSKGH